ncbi:MAG: 23S rRNA (adenine(2030)-N(6))-methyltransferase RlmJ [Steroidobacteraceae bacterium]
MNYRHLFHAGNFADVAKHIALLDCLDALKRKQTPFMVLDTHAGRGWYDLRSAESRKSREADAGVQALIAGGFDEPALASYLKAVGAARGAKLARYPGSPALIGEALRPGDRAVFVELVAAEARAIEREVQTPGRMRTVIGDGYAQLKALLPPAERRGLVLIDPPYEDADELRQVLPALALGYERWPTGVYLLWYPIISARARESLHARATALRIPKMLYADIAVRADDAGVGLAGSGMLLINPPFGVEERLREQYDAVHRHLAAAGGYVDIGWLTPERY